MIKEGKVTELKQEMEVANLMFTDEGLYCPFYVEETKCKVDRKMRRLQGLRDSYLLHVLLTLNKIVSILLNGNGLTSIRAYHNKKL